MLTGDFLNINARLFHVETKDIYVNICIELRELPLSEIQLKASRSRPSY